MREKLINHAKEVVQPATEKRALDAAYSRALPMALAIVEKRYPPRDMRVLQKYGAASATHDFRIQSPEGGVCEFTISEDRDMPLTPTNKGYGIIYLGDARSYAALTAWAKARDEYEAERKKRIYAFQTLVHAVSYVEDVTEVWPEAVKVIPARELTAQVAPEQIAIIKADMRERKAA
jgi:hypothetical protein